MRRIVHIDVNAFYCSCERLFRPDLSERPIIVLSNGDGCVVARDARAKSLGVPMGQPWFEMKRFARNHGIAAFSSNYALYGDLSRRVMAVIGQFSPDVEIYSIDEAFIELTWQPKLPAEATARAIRDRVLQWTGLPTCVGVGRTKTEAKLADWIAKHDASFDGVCDLVMMDPAERVRRFRAIEVRKVWGIGRKLAEHLRSLGVVTVADLVAADALRLREQFNVVLERTVRELQGESCIDLERDVPARQQIVVSRTFSMPVFNVDVMAESVRDYMHHAASKLRTQGSVAGAIGVWIETNRFRAQDAQHHGSSTMTLPKATDDSGMLTTAAVALMRKIFKPGCRYWKSGVMLLDLSEKGSEQSALFDAPSFDDENRKTELMGVVDAANRKWGQGTLGMGHAGLKQAGQWCMKRTMLSPRYTTRWDELPIVC